VPGFPLGGADVLGARAARRLGESRVLAHVHALGEAAGRGRREAGNLGDRDVVVDHPQQQRHPNGPADWFTGDVYVCGSPSSGFFEPGENHWHGAAPNRFMIHTHWQETGDSGSHVTWGEHVTGEQYKPGSRH